MPSSVCPCTLLELHVGSPGQQPTGAIFAHVMALTHKPSFGRSVSQKEIDESGKFREDIHEVMIKINSLLISTAKSEPKVVDTTSGAIKKGSTTKLPKLEISLFCSEAMRLNGLLPGITSRHQFIRIKNSKMWNDSVT